MLMEKIKNKSSNYSDTMDTLLLDSDSKNKARILLETGTNELEILEFYIDIPSNNANKKEPLYFGINVAKVREVIESPNLKPPISAPHPCYLGVIPLREIVLPVLDISVWLNLERVKNNQEIIVVTEFSQAITGFLVSGVTEIHRFGWKEVIPPHSFFKKIKTNSTTGTVEVRDHFTQLLDLEYVLADINPEYAAETWKTNVKSKRNYTALVADDSATISLMLKKNLEAANFSIHTVSNGEEALNFLQKKQLQAENEHKSITDYIQLVVADIEMPQMDGFSLTKTIKDDSKLKQLPVILYSSIITKELLHKGEFVKADIQVAKPELNTMAEKAIQLLDSIWNQK
jgi:two-component system chemotaxis response regulator CheV